MNRMMLQLILIIAFLTAGIALGRSYSER